MFYGRDGVIIYFSIGLIVLVITLDTNNDHMVDNATLDEMLQRMWIYFKTRAPKRGKTTPTPRADATLRTSEACIRSLSNRANNGIGMLHCVLGTIEFSQEWIDRAMILLEQDGKTPKTRNVYAYAITRFMAANGYPNLIAPICEYENVEHSYHTPEEIQRMIDVTYNIEHRCILAFLYYLAVRNGELCLCKREWLDMDNKVCKILAPKQRMKERMIPVDKALVPYLDAWLKKRESIVEKMKKDGRVVPDTLFINNKGRPFKQHGVRMIVVRAAQKAGIEGGSHPHCYRHARSQWWLHNDIYPIGLDMVAYLLGDTVKTVDDAYNHSKSRMAILDIDRLNKLEDEKRCH